MFKKFMSVVVGASCVFATLGVSAASVNTTTSYTGEKGTIAVTTTVSGATAGEQYTYLVHDKNVAVTSITGDKIVYVDQKKVAQDATSVNFSYKTDSKNVGASVRVGGAAKDTQGSLKDDQEVSYKVTKVDGTDSVGAGKVSLAGLQKDDLVEIPINESPYAYKELQIADATLSEEDFLFSQNKIYLKVSFFLDESGKPKKDEVCLYLTAYTFGEEKYATMGLGFMVEDGTKSIIAMGKYELGSDGYGIMFSADNQNWVKFPALAKGTDGLFAVKLEDFAALEIDTTADTAYLDGTFTDGAKPFEGANTIYAKAYAGENIGDTYQVAVNGDAANGTKVQ